jgi:hypothetical protein
MKAGTGFFNLFAETFVVRRTFLFVSFLAALSVAAGLFFSKASLVGRIGISLFYKQYHFLKIWWQGALAVYFILLVVFFTQGAFRRRLPGPAARLVHWCFILIALAGLFFTYNDFRHTTTHRWLGERFHLGGYLFWGGWILTSCFYLFQKTKRSTHQSPSDPITA